MAAAASITSKYQITVPKELREDMRVSAGDKLLFIKRGEQWVVKPVPAKFSDALRELGRGLKGDFETYHKEFEEGWEDR